MTLVAPPHNDNGTMLDLLDRNVEQYGYITAIIDGPHDSRTRISWREFAQRASSFALALKDLGVAKGDAVGLHMVNRAEHPIADLGALMAGAVPISFYNTLAPEQLHYAAEDCAAKVIVADADHLEKWNKVRGEIATLEHIIVVDGDESDESTLHYAPLLAAGEAGLGGRRSELHEIRKTITPDDTLTIIYTSGTTGPPKGVILTHAGIRFQIDRLMDVLEESAAAVNDDKALKVHAKRYGEWVRDGKLAIKPGLSQMSYLPLAHVAERFATYYNSINLASTVTYVRDLNDLPQILPATHPTTFAAVPRVWEKFHAAIYAKLDDEPNPRRQKLGRLALDVAQTYGAAWIEERQPSLRDRILYPLFERLVYGRMREAMGFDKCIIAVSGAAPIAPELLALFAGIGIPISEAYGMTESSVVITLTPPHRPRYGTVGPPIAHTEVKIADDGEILARGPHITPGYLNKPKQTAETIDADGWLHTGDLGEFDNAGYLKIIGRKKELIVNAAGKNMSPNNIEEAIKGASPILGQVCAIGDRRPYNVALITLDSEALPSWCKAHGISFTTLEDAVEDPQVQGEVKRAIDEGNEKLSRVEQIKRWKVLEREWTIESPEITPTMKLRRTVIHDHYADVINTLYED